MVNTRPAAQSGFTYLSVIFILAILSGGLALLGEVWDSAARRDKEAELLFVGQQYRQAIERYYLGGQRQYPRSLDDLLKDPRRPTTERYLRTRYLDPITGTAQWGIVQAPGGGIMGVHSLSDQAPLKTANFRRRDSGFENLVTYADWKFIYAPTPQAAASRPAARAPSR